MLGQPCDLALTPAWQDDAIELAGDLQLPREPLDMSQRGDADPRDGDLTFEAGLSSQLRNNAAQRFLSKSAGHKEDAFGHGGVDG